MFNQEYAKRYLENVMLGFREGIEALREKYPGDNDGKEIVALAFQVTNYELYNDSEFDFDTLDSINQTMIELPEKIEGYILNGDDIGCDLGEYASLILGDHIDFVNFLKRHIELNPDKNGLTKFDMSKVFYQAMKLVDEGKIDEASKLLQPIVDKMPEKNKIEQAVDNNILNVLDKIIPHLEEGNKQKALDILDNEIAKIQNSIDKLL